MEDPVFLSEAGSKGIEFKAICTGKIIILAAHFTRIITIIPQSWTLEYLSAIMDSQQKFLEAIFMFRIPELAMPRTRTVTTICNGKKEIWDDREEALNFFLRQMMTTEGEERDRAECIYIQLLHGLEEGSDEDE